MQIGMIHKLIVLFNEAFRQLQAHVELRTVEELAVMVHKAMTVQARNFHNLEHVFNFGDPNDPIQTLAALFHDIVYYQVDQGFFPEISGVINPYIDKQDDDFYIIEQVPADEKLVKRALDIFDLKEGMKLTPLAGLNEFLSAIVMNKKLEQIVPEKELLKITLCIEATIPFRSLTDEGQSHFNMLESRLSRISQEQNLPMTEEEIQEAVQLAVRFANKDVENFAELDTGKFLDNTWKLLPEMNVALRSRQLYSIREYRRAIQKMEAFLSALNPDNVFHSYRGVPPEGEFAHMAQQARRNVKTTRQYLRIKLLAQAILEALAVETGGDAPLCLFMGDLPKEGEEVQRLEEYLPDLAIPTWADTSSTLFSLLASGQRDDANFDLRVAPLTFFVYKSLTPTEREHALQSAREMFDGRIMEREFLTNINQNLVSIISKASAAMVLTRSEQLLKFAST